MATTDELLDILMKDDKKPEDWSAAEKRTQKSPDKSIVQGLSPRGAVERFLR